MTFRDSLVTALAALETKPNDHDDRSNHSEHSEEQQRLCMAGAAERTRAHSSPVVYLLPRPGSSLQSQGAMYNDSGGVRARRFTFPTGSLSKGLVEDLYQPLL